MKAWKLQRPGSLDGLMLCDHEIPPLERHQVRVRIHAAALNNRDAIVVYDKYRFAMPVGRIPLSDAAGEVIAVGADVTRFKVGDRVTPNYQQNWIGGPLRSENLGTDLGGTIDGVLAQELNFDAAGLVRIAPHLTDEEAASLCCAGITAWNAVRGLQPGDSVLVQGTGGVGVFAMQFARLFGARVIATTSSSAKAERLKAMNVSDIINYQETPDWAGAALDMTGGQGVDRVIEIGGPNTFKSSLRAVRAGGQISVVGFSGGPGDAIDPLSLIGRGVRIETMAVGSRDDYEAMMRAIAVHSLRPVIDRVFPFGEVREAFTYLAGKQHFGKIVIRCR